MIDPTLLFAQAINFVLLVALLYRLLYKPVREFMDNRTNEIQQNIRSAEENQAEAERLRQDLEARLNDGRKEARRFLDEAAKRAEQIQADMVSEAKAEADSIVQRAQEEVRLEKEKAWADLQKQAGDLSLLLASKIVQQSLDQAQHQHLIDQTIAELNNITIEGSQ